MEYLDLEVRRGETFERNVFLKNKEGTAINLTGAEAYCQLRPAPESSDLSATVSAVVTGAEGKIALGMSAALTRTLAIGSYAYDLALREAGGRVTYLFGGCFTLLPSVSKSAS